VELIVYEEGTYEWAVSYIHYAAMIYIAK